MSFIKKALSKTKNTHISIVNKLSLQFAVDIEKLRIKRNLTNKQLAEKVGTSPAYITKVMQGEANYTVDTLAKFAHALDADIDIVICDKMARSSDTTIFKMGQLNKSNLPKVSNGQDYIIMDTFIEGELNGSRSNAAPAAA